MERESFEDTEVAEVLNRDFIAIKVDKEERPDVDSIYMTVCTALNGHGGWPLTIIMTPEQKPFYAGTYLPKHSRGNMVGLMELLIGVRTTWKEDKERLMTSGQEITKAVIEHVSKEGICIPKAATIGTAFVNYRASFDAEYGGFGQAPKFPTPHNLMFMLRYSRLFGNEQALKMVEHTLNSMYRGGIYDHIGGGFSRYSTDDCWLVPHFEKMLYDNALLAIIYSEAYQETQNPLYRMVVNEVLAYVKREMQHEEGGFFSAQDADSEGEEGKYYVFTPEEVIKVLGEQDAKLFCDRFDITENGNFEGKSIPNLIDEEKLFVDTEMLLKLNEWKKKLYDYRLKRCHLHKDDKILTSWNGLMIAAYAKAYQVFMEPSYLDVAKRAFSFVKEKLCTKQGRLYIRYRDGEHFGDGCVDDYAFLCYAALELYEACYESEYLLDCMEWMDVLIKHFWDRDGHGFFLYADDVERLIMRPKETYDGAVPAGNSVAAYVLLRLSRMGMDEKYQQYADECFAFLAGSVEDYPNAYGFGLLSYLERFCPVKELICFIKKESIVKVNEVLAKHYVPNLTVVIVTKENKEELFKLLSFLKEYPENEEEMTFYMCENHACMEPFHELSRLEEVLEEI